MVELIVGLAMWVAALQVLDGYSTLKAMKRGMIEANPIVRSVMAEVGVLPALVALKGFNILFMCYLASEAGKAAPDTLIWMLLVTVTLAAIYSAVVWNNFRLIRDAKSNA